MAEDDTVQRYDTIPHPTPFHRPPSNEPGGHWVTRAMRAVFVERRLPYRVQIGMDRLCNRLGVRHKTVRADGLRVRVRRLTCDENFVCNIIQNREYTGADFEVGKRDVVIDIGGNIGTFALHAAKRATEGRVFTFEPNQENFRLLLRNLALNRVSNVVPVKAAVSGNDGEIKLFNNSQGGFHSVLAERGRDPDRYETVTCVSLKTILDDYGIARCNFLKVDCEGAEYDILYKLPTEYYSRIDRIAMEWHGDADAERRRRQSDGLVAHLQNVGFRIDVYEECIGFRCGFIRAQRPEIVRSSNE